MAAGVSEFDLDMCNAVRRVVLNGGLGVRKVNLRINLMREGSRMEQSIRADAVKELIDVVEVSSRDIEKNVVAAESRRKCDILRDLKRCGLIEGKRARNP